MVMFLVYVRKMMRIYNMGIGSYGWFKRLVESPEGDHYVTFYPTYKFLPYWITMLISIYGYKCLLWHIYGTRQWYMESFEMDAKQTASKSYNLFQPASLPQLIQLTHLTSSSFGSYHPSVCNWITFKPTIVNPPLHPWVTVLICSCTQTLTHFCARQELTRYILRSSVFFVSL